MILYLIKSVSKICIVIFRGESKKGQYLSRECSL